MNTQNLKSLERNNQFTCASVILNRKRSVLNYTNKQVNQQAHNVVSTLIFSGDVEQRFHNVNTTFQFRG